LFVTSPQGAKKFARGGLCPRAAKTEQRIVEIIRQDPHTTTEAMGKILAITKRGVLKQVNKLKSQYRVRRVGPARWGYWEVIEK